MEGRIALRHRFLRARPPLTAASVIEPAQGRMQVKIDSPCRNFAEGMERCRFDEAQTGLSPARCSGLQQLGARADVNTLAKILQRVVTYLRRSSRDATTKCLVCAWIVVPCIRQSLRRNKPRHGMRTCLLLTPVDNEKIRTQKMAQC